MKDDYILPKWFKWVVNPITIPALVICALLIELLLKED